MYFYVRLSLYSYLACPHILYSGLYCRDGCFYQVCHICRFSLTYCIVITCQNMNTGLMATILKGQANGHQNPSLLYSQGCTEWAHLTLCNNRWQGMWGPVCIHWTKLWDTNISAYECLRCQKSRVLYVRATCQLAVLRVYVPFVFLSFFFCF